MTVYINEKTGVCFYETPFVYLEITLERALIMTARPDCKVVDLCKLH